MRRITRLPTFDKGCLCSERDSGMGLDSARSVKLADGMALHVAGCPDFLVTGYWTDFLGDIPSASILPVTVAPGQTPDGAVGSIPAPGLAIFWISVVKHSLITRRQDERSLYVRILWPTHALQVL